MKEKDFQEKVLIPLFRKMGFQDVTSFGGGTLERGKDIVMWKASDLGQRLNYGVVVKAKKITGNAETTAGAMNVLNQVRQMLKASYLNPVSGETERIQRCFVANSKDVTKEAMYSIEGELENGLDKLLEWIHPSCNLFDLIEKYLPELTIQDRLSSIQQDLDKATENTPFRIVATNQFAILGRQEQPEAETPFKIKGLFAFDETPEGQVALKQLNDHFDFGLPAEIDGRFIKSFEFPESFPDALKPTLSPEAKLILGSSKSEWKRRVRIELEAPSGEQESIDYLELKMVRKGRLETVFSNEEQDVPWVIELIADHDNNTARFNYYHKTNKINVYEQLFGVRVIFMLGSGGMIRITDLQTSLEVLKADLPKKTWESGQVAFKDFLEKLVLIQTRTGVLLSVDGEISDAEVSLVNRVHNVITTGVLAVSIPQYSVSYKKEVALEILDDFHNEKVGTIISKSEPDSVELFGQHISIGHNVFISTVFIESGEDKRVRKEIASATDDTITINYTTNESPVYRKFLNWLSSDEMESIQALAVPLPEIMDPEQIGTWVTLLDFSNQTSERNPD